MKSRLIVLVALLSLILSGCLVKSLHPFYKEKDLYFDNSLIGTWIDKDSSKWYVKQIYVSFGEGKDKKEYRNKGYVVGHESKKGVKTQSYDVYLFKINNQLYADFSASLAMTFTSNDEYTSRVNSHNRAKVVIVKDEITFIFFNAEWLAELIVTNKVRIAHEFVKYPEPVSLKYKGEYVLTASTDELQKFIAKYGNDPKAFASKPKKILEDGTYHWNAGDGEYTGKMTFRDSFEATIKLKKINEK